MIPYDNPSILLKLGILHVAKITKILLLALVVLIAAVGQASHVVGIVYKLLMGLLARRRRHHLLLLVGYKLILS